MARVYQQMNAGPLHERRISAFQSAANGASLSAKPEDIQAGKTSYSPISNYNQTWQQRNNPQIGAATMGILNGDEFDKWAGRLKPDWPQQRWRWAARIDPNVQSTDERGA